MSSKKVAVYDPVFLTRKGLLALVEDVDTVELAFETNSFRLLTNRLEEKHVDMVILNDQNLTALDYLTGSAEMTLKHDVIVIMPEKVHEQSKRLMDSGVRSILTEYCDEEEITTALRTVAGGKRFFCDRVLNDVLGEDKNEKEEQTQSILTERETEVLKLIAEGMSSTQVAEKLFISIHTINSHRKNILRKLDLKSPAQLILYAIEHGLIK